MPKQPNENSTPEPVRLTTVKPSGSFLGRAAEGLIAKLFQPNGTPMNIESEFINNTGRFFAWLDRGERMAAESQLPHKPVGKVREITGRASRKEKQEPEGPLDNPHATLHIYTFKRQVGDLQLDCFFWQVRYSKQTAGDYADSITDAAEKAVKHWYKMTTKVKFAKARAFTHNPIIVLLGRWMTNEEYKAQKRGDMLTVIPDVSTDDRTDDRIFVMGADGDKEKALVKPKKIERGSKTPVESIDPLAHTVHLSSGVKLPTCLDWYIFKPEKQVRGEMMCERCEAIGDRQVVLDACWVRGMGALCGPCRDFLFENDKLDDFMFDQELPEYVE